MKGILLAGGLGTRMYPITKEFNKHVLPIYDMPMFFWPLRTLIDSGIKEIAVISGPPHGKQVKNLISYFSSRQRLNIKYVNQPRPLGMPDGIYKCKNFVGKDSVIVSAADNIYGGNFKKEVKTFKDGALSFLRKVKDPQRYGVPVFERSKIIKIVEKPKKPKTNWVVTGPHFFDDKVFEFIKKLRPSKRGEFEISDLNTFYLKQGRLKLIQRTDFWIDAGTYDTLLKASLFVKNKRKL